jgi:hypothetical protein
VTEPWSSTATKYCNWRMVNSAINSPYELHQMD